MLQVDREERGCALDDFCKARRDMLQTSETEEHRAQAQRRKGSDSYEQPLVLRSGLAGQGTTIPGGCCHVAAAFAMIASQPRSRRRAATWRRRRPAEAPHAPDLCCSEAGRRYHLEQAELRARRTQLRQDNLIQDQASQRAGVPRDQIEPGAESR